MTAPKHLASKPVLTLEDIEHVAALVWAWLGARLLWLAAQCVRLAAWLLDDPVGDWAQAMDPIDGYGEPLSIEGLGALRLEHLNNLASVGSGSFPVVTLQSSLLRPGVTAGLEVSR